MPWMRARKNAARIRKLYEAGSRYQDLATQFGISITTVRTLLKEQGYKPKTRLKPKTCSSPFQGCVVAQEVWQVASCYPCRSQASSFGSLQTRDGCFCRVSSREEIHVFELTSLLSRYGILPLLLGKRNSRGVFCYSFSPHAGDCKPVPADEVRLHFECGRTIGSPHLFPFVVDEAQKTKGNIS
jgi:hypothetical protein